MLTPGHVSVMQMYNDIQILYNIYVDTLAYKQSYSETELYLLYFMCVWLQPCGVVVESLSGM